MEPLNIKVTPPQVSQQTMKAMWQFFARTSIPRLMEQKNKEREAL